jgi:hypothetical protein
MGSTSWEHHGLSLPLNKKQTVQVSNASNGIAIFAEFAKLLGKPVASPHELSIKDGICHIPELHEMMYSLGQLPWSWRKFLPGQIDCLVNSGKDKLSTEIKYEKRNEARVNTAKISKGDRQEYFVKREEEHGWVSYRSKNRKSVSQKDFPQIYHNMQKEYVHFDLAALLTRSGYKDYGDLQSGPYHHLSFSLALLFYLGSVARYRPTEVEELTTGELSPLVSEALAVMPR